MVNRHCFLPTSSEDFLSLIRIQTCLGLIQICFVVTSAHFVFSEIHFCLFPSNFFQRSSFWSKKNKNQNKKPKNISCVFLTLKEINAFFFCCFFVSFFCICHGNFQNSEVYENIFVFADIKRSPLHFAIFLTWDFRARPPNCAIMCQQKAWYQKSSFLFIYSHDFLFFFSNLIQMLFDGTTKSLSHLHLFIIEEYGIFWNQRCSKFNDD